MAHIYTPGLKVSSRVQHRARRILPIQGDVLVDVGARVHARDIVAQTFMPGSITPLNIANILSLPPGDVPECMLKQEGDQIDIGEPLAVTKGIFGFFKAEYKSKVAGTIESISDVTGQVIVRGEPEPIQVEAYLAGEVVEVIPQEGVVIEANVAFVQGIFGIGGETYGPIHIACSHHNEDLTEELISDEMKDAVIIGGALVTGTAVKKAIDVGASAIVAGGMDDQDLKEILGYDLGVAITGSEKIGITLIITEGFGEIAMAERTYQLLTTHNGAEAAVNGATQIRAGVMRPEIIIPLQEEEKTTIVESEHPAGLLEVGTSVRIIRDPYFGLIGQVTALPSEPQTLESESKARVLEVQIDPSKKVTVPRANVELIEG